MPRIKPKGVWWALLGVLTLCAAMYASNAKAETAVYLGAWSKHVVTNGNYNETHDLIAVEHDKILAARFVNSYSRETYALAYGWHKRWGDFRGSIYAGGMMGYRSCYGDDGDYAMLCPMVVPAVSYTKYRVQPTVLLLGEAVAISFRVELY